MPGTDRRSRRDDASNASSSMAEEPREPYFSSLPTFIFLLFSSFIERTAEQVVPALFPRIDDTFELGPMKLAVLTLARAVPQCVLAVLGGFVAQNVNRKYVLPFGCIIFGVGLCGFCLIHSFIGGIAAMIAGGVGLASLLPGSYSLIVDNTRPKSVGMAFGWHFAVGAAGCAIISYSSVIAGPHVYHGLTGWRFMCFLIGMIGVWFGILGIFLVKDPRMEYQKLSWWKINVANGIGGLDFAKRLYKILCTPTFLIIVAQGMCSQVPFNTFVFLAMFLEAVGYNTGQCASLMLVFWLCNGVGGMIAGYLGDLLQDRYGHKGRIRAAQASIGLSIFLSIFMFVVVPKSSDKIALHFVVLGLLGLFCGWLPPVCTFPLIKDITLPEDHSTAFALDRCCEALLGTLLCVATGGIAESFGWKDPQMNPGEETMKKNADAMAEAVIIIIIASWGATFLILFGLYFTCGRDHRYCIRMKQWKDGIRPVEPRRVPMGIRFRHWTGDIILDIKELSVQKALKSIFRKKDPSGTQQVGQSGDIPNGTQAIGNLPHGTQSTASQQAPPPQPEPELRRSRSSTVSLHDYEGEHSETRERCQTQLEGVNESENSGPNEVNGSHPNWDQRSCSSDSLNEDRGRLSSAESVNSMEHLHYYLNQSGSLPNSSTNPR